MFSILHIIIALSLLSLITSISYSFQPSKDSSIKTSLIGLALNPISICFLNSSILYAVEPPVPPKVNEGLIIIGNLISSIILRALSVEFINPPFAVGILIFSIQDLNFSLFSAFWIALILAPISSTLYLVRIFLSCNLIVISNAVCPPTVGSMASGLSFMIICSIASTVIGSKYVASAIFLSVIIVAGFELIKIILKPSFFNALHA